ncbi:MAG: dTDP-4-dehydrorhamnose reductase [Bacteroidales bacterium]|jgi:dTDP-4-dehydrorhamnose reductase|nr:dTDP-4-dehydrorhamnose reductase [Bacteroidales bacterium]
MNLLITGANGQLGNELRRLSVGYERLRFFFTDVKELDITQPDAVEKYFVCNHIQAVVNCAAYTAVDKAETDEAAAMLVNAVAVRNLTEACTRHHAQLIHISTDYVFDGRACVPYREDHPTSPLSAYGRTKLAGEKEALKSARSVIIRTSWLYSSFGNNFVKTMLRLGRERESLNVVFDQTGTPTYAADLARCIMTIVEKMPDNGFVPGIFHFSGEGVCSWYDFARLIMLSADLKCSIQPVESKNYPTLAVRPHYSVLNKAAVKTAYGIVIPHWQESLEKCLHEILYTRTV